MRNVTGLRQARRPVIFVRISRSNQRVSGGWASDRRFSENLLVNTTPPNDLDFSLRVSDSVLLGPGNGFLVNSQIQCFLAEY